MKPRRLHSETILSMVTTSEAHRGGGLVSRSCAPMPIYEYRRQDGTTFEVMQRMTDDPLTEDPETGQRRRARLARPRRALQGLGLLQHRLRDEARSARRRSPRIGAAAPAEKTDAKATGEEGRHDVVARAPARRRPRRRSSSSSRLVLQETLRRRRRRQRCSGTLPSSAAQHLGRRRPAADRHRGEDAGERRAAHVRRGSSAGVFHAIHGRRENEPLGRPSSPTASPASTSSRLRICCWRSARGRGRSRPAGTAFLRVRASARACSPSRCVVPLLAGAA